MSLSYRVLCLAAITVAAGVLAGSAPAVSTGVVVSQVYGGAGCGSAGCSTYQNDYIELFNRGSSPVSLNGWSVQYAATTGTVWQATALPNVSLGAGQYFLVAESFGANGVNPIPTPDATGTISMSATVGKVALVNTTPVLSGSCPTGASIVDFVGYGTTTNCWEGTGPTPDTSTTNAALRGAGGCTETDQNATDFALGAPTPRNTSSATNSCAPPSVKIHDIQGAAHISPLDAQSVSTSGIVSAKTTNGFWMQEPDASADANDATSEGIFVFTTSAPTANVGDNVTVTATVSEFRGTSTNLTTTELTSPSVAVNSSGNPLPTPIVVGTGGRMQPTTVIEDDATGDVETSGSFDPATDGIDFYESLEAMRVRLNNPVATEPNSGAGSPSFGEISVLPDDGAGASVRTTRGGIVVRATDFNPERIILDDVLAATPVVNVGDHFSPTQVDGVMDYSFGNFKLLVTTSSLTAVSGGLTQETASVAPAAQLSIATFNVNNLDPGDGAAKFNSLAATIVNNLRSPDIVALEEVQDNNGPTNDSVTDASTTFTTLISAITTASGPTYDYRQIDPVDDQDGGEPGGNIRVGYLFNSSRVTFVDKAGGTSTAANTVSATGLQFSPGRIDPTNAAFNSSRKPLAAEFTFNSQKVFLIANHFNSKGGDQPLYGHFQPPTLSSEVQRDQQAQIVNNFVDSIIANVSNPQIVVLGDFNDFEFSNPLNTLKGGVLVDEIELLPQAERYTYVFEGNSQALDHILVNNHVSLRLPTYDVLHVNSEFAVQNSDHEPQLLRYDPTAAPTAAGVTSLVAVRRGGLAFLRWRTASEIGIAGFNVYREEAGRRVRLNRNLIAASGSASGRRYAWNAGRIGSSRYWLQVVRRDGARVWRGPVRVTGGRS